VSTLAWGDWHMPVDNAQNRYKAIIENMIDGFAYYKVILDDTGKPCDFIFIDVNNKFESITGLNREFIINKRITELYGNPKESEPDWISIGAKVAFNGEPVKIEAYSPAVNKWFSYSMFSYEYGYLATIFHDITDSIISSEKLRKSEEKYRNVFSATQDAIFITDHKTGNIIDANPAACKLYGYTIDEIVKLNRINFVADTKKMFENIENNVLHLSLYHKKKDGTIFPVDMSISKCIYNKELVRIIAARDITDHKLVEDLKKELEKNLLIINESKIYESLRTEFFANISHELRTPLNVILGSVQLINLYLDNEKEEFDIKKYKKYSKTIKQNCFRLLRLVNNLIDITKIDAGYFELSLDNKNIVTVVEDITLSVAEYVQNKQINLVFDTETEERVMAVDFDIIERILLNLLSNSIKFTKPGGYIYVNLYERSNNFIISVKDTGIGIPEEKIHLIFDRFMQVDKSLTRSREGSGIGLSLVKSLVELHGGSINASSKLGEGTEFIIELPMKIIAENELHFIQRENIDDNRVERIIIEFSDIYA
jgi:PAS domain S-box-containing protein